MNDPPNIGKLSGSFEIDKTKYLKNMSLGPKYLLMSRVSTSNETLTNVSPFLIQKVIDSVCGEVDLCKKLRSGIILIKTKSFSQASKLICLVSLSPTIKIEVTEHKTLNFTKGVIYTNELRYIPEEEILKEETIKNQNIVDVKKIMKKQGENLIETGLVILTFSALALPEVVKLGYEIAIPSPYIALPMKCHNCLRFGHISKFCKNNKLCINCGRIDHLEETETCERAQNCNNCNEHNLPETNHSTVSKKCPIFLKYKEIEAIKTIEKVDTKTAHHKYNERHPNKTYAKVTIVNYSSVAETPKTNHSMETNTLISQKNENTSKQQTTYSLSPHNLLENLSSDSPSSTIKPATSKANVKILPKNISRRVRQQLKKHSTKTQKRGKSHEIKLSESSETSQMEE